MVMALTPQKKYMHKEKSNYRKHIVCNTLFQVTFFMSLLLETIMFLVIDTREVGLTICSI